MKKFITLDKLFQQIKSKGFNSWFDKLTFFHIFFIWTSVILVFGFIYYFFVDNISFLFYTPFNVHIKGLSDSVYFSFITATSTGYGDIVPFGFFKFITIIEIVFGLVLLAFVTSKLVSIKQDIILSEIYEISFNEKINRLRSSLLVFRQNLSRIINKIEENSIRKREINDIYIYISSLEDVLNEIITLIATSNKNNFKKVLDPLNTELLFNSILHSFEKLNELINTLNQHKLEWKSNLTLDLIRRCISLNDALFAKLDSSKYLTDKLITDLNAQKNKLVALIKNGIEPLSI